MGIGGIMILFVILCAVSILGAVLLLLAKSERGKSIALYLLSIWGMAIAVISATSLPRNEVGQQILAWGFGFLAVAAVILHIRAGSKGMRYASCCLAVLSLPWRDPEIIFYLKKAGDYGENRIYGRQYHRLLPQISCGRSRARERLCGSDRRAVKREGKGGFHPQLRA